MNLTEDFTVNVETSRFCEFYCDLKVYLKQLETNFPKFIIDKQLKKLSIFTSTNKLIEQYVFSDNTSVSIFYSTETKKQLNVKYNDKFIPKNINFSYTVDDLIKNN